MSYKMNRFQRFLQYWPLAWLDLIDAIVWIITLGQWKPNLGIRFMLWSTKKRITETNNL
jgi:uncharacterized membrane protein YjgN (DUF898 family)